MSTPALRAVPYLSHCGLGPFWCTMVRAPTSTEAKPSAVPWKRLLSDTAPRPYENNGGGTNPAQWCTNHRATRAEHNGLSGNGCARTNRGRTNVLTRRGAIPRCLEGRARFG